MSEPTRSKPAALKQVVSGLTDGQRRQPQRAPSGRTALALLSILVAWSHQESAAQLPAATTYQLLAATPPDDPGQQQLVNELTELRTRIGQPLPMSPDGPLDAAALFQQSVRQTVRTAPQRLKLHPPQPPLGYQPPPPLGPEPPGWHAGPPDHATDRTTDGVHRPDDQQAIDHHPPNPQRLDRESLENPLLDEPWLTAPPATRGHYAARALYAPRADECAGPAPDTTATPSLLAFQAAEPLVAALRTTSSQLDQLANHLESERRYHDADQLRQLAQRLRAEARRRDIILHESSEQPVTALSNEPQPLRQPTPPPEGTGGDPLPNARGL
jgi:hypothetical protein